MFMYFEMAGFYSFIDFFCNDTATSEIYTYLHTLALHDALPICLSSWRDILSMRRLKAASIRSESSGVRIDWRAVSRTSPCVTPRRLDRKSTRLNSSH